MIFDFSNEILLSWNDVEEEEEKQNNISEWNIFISLLKLFTENSFFVSFSDEKHIDEIEKDDLTKKNWLINKKKKMCIIYIRMELLLKIITKKMLEIEFP